LNTISVKVLDNNGTGFLSDCIAGVLFVVEEVKKKRAKFDDNIVIKSVINLSLGTPKSNYFNSVINRI
jgi:subtilisin family serine protease